MRDERDVEAANKRALVCAEGDLDEREMTRFEIEDRAPYHVLRILNGAQIRAAADPSADEILCEGSCYVVSKDASAIYQRIAAKIQAEVLSMNGIVHPFGVESTIRILDSAMSSARTECKVPPEKLRVLFLRNGDGGCAFYRTVQPVFELTQMEDVPLWAEENSFLTYRLGRNYDVIVAPRIADAFTISVLRSLQQAKKVIIYETDDLLSNMPNWNPSNEHNTPETQVRREFFTKMADACIVSTEELKDYLKRPDSTWVCHNGINANLWPLRAVKQDVGTVRILWAGSSSHEGDLQIVAKVIRRLIARFKERIQFLFAGCIPNEFKQLTRKQNGTMAERVHPDLEKNVKFIGTSTPWDWPRLVEGAQANIAISPLEIHPFNECKSELKVLEAWAAGLPIVATRIAPYMRAIEDESQGLLVENSTEAWEVALTHLITKPEERLRLAENGLKRLIDRYLMPRIAREYEIALYSIAAGKVMRPECNEAMAKRLKEIAS
ncbi:MAG: glycosyltransferase family 4 protein [Planctomycetota bacterium]|nr:glycosyltransferase family 4 protein [Planctomycetota bacterium]